MRLWLETQKIRYATKNSSFSTVKTNKIVQNYAKKCFAENLNLFDVISADKIIINKISPKKLKSIFSYSKHFKNVNLIFRRVFK